MTSLLDGKVLIALSVADHVHHGAVASWFAGLDGGFATTPITQGTLLRFLVREGFDASSAVRVLEGVTRHAQHTFWPDVSPYDSLSMRGVVGHRQVTDAYLAAQARTNTGRLATLDRGVAAAHADIADLIDIAG